LKAEEQQLDPEQLITYCGLYGGHCCRWRGFPHFRELARELSELVDAMGCGHWMPHFVQEFKYEEFCKGLDSFGSEDHWYTCTKCCRGGDSYPDCPIRKCCVERGEELCFECERFPCEIADGFYDIRARGEEYHRLGRAEWLKRQLELVRLGYELHTGKCYQDPITDEKQG